MTTSTEPRRLLAAAPLATAVELDAEQGTIEPWDDASTFPLPTHQHDAAAEKENRRTMRIELTLRSAVARDGLPQAGNAKK